jgi:protein-tyrosine-phosphatase
MLKAYLGKNLRPDHEVQSAGLFPDGVDPRAIRAMAEDGIVIAGEVSVPIKAVKSKSFDFIVCTDPQ